MINTWLCIKDNIIHKIFDNEKGAKIYKSLNSRARVILLSETTLLQIQKMHGI